MTPHLVARGLELSFGDRPVLRGLDLDLSGGSLVAVSGPSGSGKTSLLMVLAGLLRAQEGTVERTGTIAVPTRAGDSVAPRPADPLPMQPLPLRAGMAERGSGIDAYYSGARSSGRRASSRRRDDQAKQKTPRAPKASKAKPGQAPRSERTAPLVGFVPQTLGLVPWLTAAENVGVVLQLLQLEPEEVRTRTEQMLAEVGLGETIDRMATDLSGGQRQRVAVAKALVAEPDVLLCDEPTAELDSDNRQVVLALLAGAATRGALVLVTTHDPEVAAACHANYALRDGKLELVGPDD